MTRPFIRWSRLYASEAQNASSRIDEDVFAFPLRERLVSPKFHNKPYFRVSLLSITRVLKLHRIDNVNYIFHHAIPKIVAAARD